MSAQSRAESLMRLVTEYRETRCSAMLDAARAEARSTLKQAHVAARQRARAALAHERERLHASIAAAEAQLATQRRFHRQREVAAALQIAWTKLEAELLACWNDAARRTAWIERALADSQATFPAQEWEIEHPPGSDREPAARWLAERGIAPARFVERAEMRAGLRIRAGHNVLDATIAGLLGDRAAVEGRLLHHLVEGRS
jgi:F0F1-type ATP synthase membrane subunit b/b'